MRKQRGKRITPAKPQVIKASARDAFSNVLARLGTGTPNLMEGTTYSLNRLTRDYGLLNALYREHWIIRQIIDIIPSDMLKNWITLTTEVSPNLLKKVDLELRKTQLIQKLKQGLQWGRLFGGAIGLMIIKGQGYDLSKPLDLRLMVPGDFCGLMVFDRWNSVDPSIELVEDVTDPEFGLPDYYTITDNTNGAMYKVHHSRLLRFTGDDLPYWESQAEQQWGASVIESIFDELKKRDNVSWNIAQLTFMASLRVLKMADMGQMLSATDEQTKAELYRTIQAQNWLMSNMGMQIIDAGDDMQSHQYTFGGISDTYKQFMMDVAGAARIPATKLFGRSPEGMNATGESDLRNYYDMISQEQEAKLRPILNKLLPVLCMSVFGAVPDDLDFEFDPVSEPSDQERADLAKCGTDNIVTAYNAGLISQRTALREMKQQSSRTGTWTNITDEEIMNASDEIEPQGEMGGFPGMGGEEDGAGGPDLPRAGRGGEVGDKPPEAPGKPPQAPRSIGDSDWEEDKHPRDGDGKFTSGGGGGKGKDSPRKKKAPKYTKEEGYKNQIGEALPGEHHGYEAIKELVKYQSGYVPAAFSRSDIGDIALPWGDDFMGLKHIIQERASQGVSMQDFLPQLTDIIQQGNLTARNGRFYISKDHYTAVISPTYFDDAFTFLLTGWDDDVPKHAKKH